jgi:glyoxylase-like metal-dependent hydrolase (beta-lactamase superfamily II)/rhodanese-related sulfurtransferase
MKKLVPLALAVAISIHAPAFADSKAAVIDEMAGYLEFVDYGGGVIFAEQIPKSEYPKMMIIDARDSGQFAKSHIPGAVNIEWRRVLEQRAKIPKDKMVLIYCNTGSLSAQAGFALRVAGYENVKILQGGFEEWKAKGGLDANAKATGAEQSYIPKAAPVTGNIYAIVGPLGQRSEANAGLNANYGFVVSANGVILIDSGASTHSAAMLERAVKEITPKPIRWVLNTGSQDHRWLGNGYFAGKGAEIHAMAGTVKTQKSFADQQLTGLKRFLGGQLSGTQPFYATQIYAMPERELSIDGVRVQWIETNAHYPGDTMLHFPNASVTFTGDLVYVDRILGVLPASNVRKAQASFKRLEALAPKHIVPGHGRVTDIAQAKRETGDYYDFLISNIGAAARNMDPIGETLDKFAKPAQFMHLENFADLHRANMNRVFTDFEANP